MNKIFCVAAFAAFVIAITQPTQAQHNDAHHDIEELIVSAPIAAKQSDTAMSVNVLSGESLRENAAGTLGETLNNLMGVNSVSFGPGVGSPVIRGQSANRVGVLQDGLGTLDASTISQDHANSIEPLLAERIEVIRGPATLLYGNGAIGGVINIMDNRIPEAMPEQFSGAVELRHNTAANENAAVIKLDGGANAFAWHLDTLYRARGDTKIPRHAIHEEEEPENAEHESAHGLIDNSDAESRNLTVGGSFIGERGFIGASISLLANNYGIPPGTHEHDEEEKEEHSAENVRIDMEQIRFNIKSGLQLDGFFESLRAHIAFNDYQHKEIEIADDVEEPGTVFNNKGLEARLLLNRRATDNSSGAFGLQLGDREFSAVGDESFIPATDIRSLGLFAVENIDTGAWLYEFGLRADNQRVSPGGNCDSDETTWSGSTAAIRRLRDDINLVISLNRSERAATVEELYSNIQTDNCSEPVDPAELVKHVATDRFEIGNPDLSTESSHNMELILRKHTGEIRGELSLFYNRIDDYIYLTNTDEEAEISRYLQQDAVFSGLEAEITLPLELNGTHIDLTLFSDYVRAELDDGSNVPRIPPLRFGTEIAYQQSSWSIKLRVTAVDKQNRTGSNETATDGYTLVDLYFDYHLLSGERETVVFIKGTNLLDEEIRNHASFIKDFAPEPGIGFEAGLRYRF